MSQPSSTCPPSTSPPSTLRQAAHPPATAAGAIAQAAPDRTAQAQAVPTRAAPAHAAPAHAAPAQATPARAHAGPGRGGRHQSSRDPMLGQWWRRLLGFVIDSLVIFIVTGALWVRLIISFANRMTNTTNAYPKSSAPAAQAAIGRVYTQTTGPFLVVFITTICLSVTYYWLLTGNWGTTIGKRCAGIWVVRARDWSKVGLGAAFVRALVFVVVGWAIPVFFLIDNLWLLWDRRRQCLHDKVARTVVVKTRAIRPARNKPARNKPARNKPARNKPARRWLARAWSGRGRLAGDGTAGSRPAGGGSAGTSPAPAVRRTEASSLPG